MNEYLNQYRRRTSWQKKILPIWSSLGFKCFGRTPLWLLPSDLTPTDPFSDGDNDDDDDIMTNPENYDEEGYIYKQYDNENEGNGDDFMVFLRHLTAPQILNPQLTLWTKIT